MKKEFFEKACKAHFGDFTFGEAYARTGRIVNISLTVSSRTMGSIGSSGSRMLLMNHTTAPDVLIRSAVHASCALPGLMEPVELLAKDRNGNIVPYMPEKFKFIDGSLKADIPMRRLSELFNVTQYVVSQVNPHIVPFMLKRTRNEGLISRVEYFAILELKTSIRKLAKLKMIPRIFGEDVSGMVLQKYRGDINIYPKLALIDHFNVIRHPDVEDMKRYIRRGERSTWPHIHNLEKNICIEQTLDKCIERLEGLIESHDKRAANGQNQPDKDLYRLKEEILCEDCKKKIEWFEEKFQETHPLRASAEVECPR